MQNESTTEAREVQRVEAQPVSVGGLAQFAVSVRDMVAQARLIQQAMHEMMRDDEHYGVIPGTSGKKSLLKPGAEKLCFLFRLAPRLEVRTTDLPGGHREITVICDLYDCQSVFRGQGVGSASTMESKHRYRGAPGRECPKCGAMSCKPSKAQYGGGYYCDDRSGGCKARFKAGSDESKRLDRMPAVRQENPDPADQWNTVLKMAKKRALVDATLTATAASDIFAQDLDDLDAREQRLTPEESAASEAPRPAATAPHDPDTGEVKRNATPPQEEPHPAITASRELWKAMQSHLGVTADQATGYLTRMAQVHGAKSPAQIAPDRLEAFSKDVIQMATEGTSIDEVEGLLSVWEEAAREQAGGDA